MDITYPTPPAPTIPNIAHSEKFVSRRIPAQATICVMPSMLMGTLIGHYARIVLVAETNEKYRIIMLGIALFDAVLGMILMRLFLTMMGMM